MYLKKQVKKVDNPFTEIKKTGKIIGLGNHTLLIRKDGDKIPILDSGAPIFGKDGELIGVVIVFRDGREQRQREAELIRLEKLNTVSQISAGIAHDFNNILATIVSNCALVKNKLKIDAFERKFF